MHGREHIVVIRTVDDGLVLHTVYFASELNERNRARGIGVSKFSAKEMALAKQLIDSLAGPFQPRQYVDEYRKNVERLIAQKRKGREVTPVEQPEPGKWWTSWTRSREAWRTAESVRKSRLQSAPADGGARRREID